MGSEEWEEVTKRRVKHRMRSRGRTEVERTVDAYIVGYSGLVATVKLE